MTGLPHPPRPAVRAVLRFRPLGHAAILLALAATGCAARNAASYPSLLPRAIETRGDAEPEAAPPLADRDPTTEAALADLRTALDAAAKAFAPAAGTAERLAAAAKGDAVGGERWIAAQTALAELDGLRAATSATVTDLDALALARAADGKPDYPALTTLREAAQAALDAQTARIAALGAALPGA